MDPTCHDSVHAALFSGAMRADSDSSLLEHSFLLRLSNALLSRNEYAFAEPLMRVMLTMLALRCSSCCCW